MADPAEALRCIGQTKFADLKHWQRVAIFISGVTASLKGGKTLSKAQLSAETFNQYPASAKNLHDSAVLQTRRVKGDRGLSTVKATIFEGHQNWSKFEK